MHVASITYDISVVLTLYPRTFDPSAARMVTAKLERSSSKRNSGLSVASGDISNGESTSSGSQAIRVMLRVRPMVSESEQDSTNIVRLIGTNSCELQGPEKVHKFEFDRVFGPDSSQHDVYEHCIRPVVDAVMHGYNGTVLAYGQTGSGKTHTMMGPSTDPEQRGAIPRMIDHLFSAASAESLVTSVSYMEIYNDKVKDLLNPANGAGDLKLGDLPTSGGAYVKNLTRYQVRTSGEVYAAMRRGDSHRSVAAHNMNANSSRSHSIFVVDVVRPGCSPEDPGTQSKLFLVDLAGSEKAAKTGARDKMLEEASNINRSLSTLGMVITALETRSAHVPYRNCKLTRILQDSLGGTSKTALIINCSPASVHGSETLSSLRFGSRASKVTNTVRPQGGQGSTIILDQAMRELLCWRRGIQTPEDQWVDVQQLQMLKASSSRAVNHVVAVPDMSATPAPGQGPIDLLTLVASLQEEIVDVRAKLASSENRLAASREEGKLLKLNAETLVQQNQHLRSDNKRLLSMRKIERIMIDTQKSELAQRKRELELLQRRADADEERALETLRGIVPRIHSLGDVSSVH